MIALIQRARGASVLVQREVVGAIGHGVLALVGVQRGDEAARATRLVERILGYRIFPDAEGRMNQDLRQCGGGLLLVPQFTLAADTRKGRRPSFAGAADPEQAQALFEALVAAARERHDDVQTGRFGADMQVSLVNDGPVTFWLEA